MTQTRQLSFKGNPIEVQGRELKVGDKLPDFILNGTDLAPITDQLVKGKIAIISVVPSLDTPVCATQTRRFNQEASKLSPGVVILTVSRDLPFAQKRWCGAEGIAAVTLGSDYKERSFGSSFGVELPTLGLLARAVFVVDRDGVIRYVEYVPEVAQEPDYEKVMEAVAALG